MSHGWDLLIILVFLDNFIKKKALAFTVYLPKNSKVNALTICHLSDISIADIYRRIHVDTDVGRLANIGG